MKMFTKTKVISSIHQDSWSPDLVGKKEGQYIRSGPRYIHDMFPQKSCPNDTLLLQCALTPGHFYYVQCSVVL